MGTKLTHTSRIELADSLRRRYQSSSGRTKKLILSEFISNTGYHPKYALHLLNAEHSALPKQPQTRNRSSLYDDAARQELIVLWEASDPLRNDDPETMPSRSLPRSEARALQAEGLAGGARLKRIVEESARPRIGSSRIDEMTQNRHGNARMQFARARSARERGHEDRRAPFVS